MNAHARQFPNYPGKVAIKKAVEAVRAIGIDVVKVRVFSDGSIELTDRSGVPTEAPKVVDEFEAWEAEGKL